MFAHKFNKDLLYDTLLLDIAWRVAAVKEILFNETSFVTKETVISGKKKLNFSNQKIKQAIDIKFVPGEQSIKDTCAAVLKDNSK